VAKKTTEKRYRIFVSHATADKETRITPVLCHVDVDTIPGMLKAKKAIHINDLPNFFAEVKKRVKGYHG
jgi:hypothetical protein